MIERYNIKKLSDIWTDESKFSLFLEVELALLSAQEESGKIPKGILTHFKNIKINPARIEEIEMTTRHDVIAFCSSVTEQLPADISKYFHFGVTSSDIIDTALSLQLKKSLMLINDELTVLRKSLLKKAHATKNILCLGRSHGMNAEPMNFAHKFLMAFAELSRRQNELNDFIANHLTGQFSGSIGNYAIIDPNTEMIALKKLGLKRETLSTQVIPRDHIAKLLNLHALMATGLERLAIEIRHLHHSDIGEVYEGFGVGQKGSSAMPHKKNPIASENISGLARVIRSHASVGLDNILLWHERDISHSSAERLVLPDNLGLMLYVLNRMVKTIDNLEINTDKIEAKVESSFTHLSSYLMHELILSEKLTREEIYSKIQKASFNATNKNEFAQLLTQAFPDHSFKLDDFSLDKQRKIYAKHTEEIITAITREYPLDI